MLLLSLPNRMFYIKCPRKTRHHLKQSTTHCTLLLAVIYSYTGLELETEGLTDGDRC